jgi:hypothetical protein
VSQTLISLYVSSVVGPYGEHIELPILVSSTCVYPNDILTPRISRNMRILMQIPFSDSFVLLPLKISVVQSNRPCDLKNCVKSIVVWGPGPVVRRCSPQSLSEPTSRRPPTHTSDSVPIDVHPTPTSLQFRVLYTYMCMHLYIL